MKKKLLIVTLLLLTIIISGIYLSTLSPKEPFKEPDEEDNETIEKRVFGVYIGSDTKWEMSIYTDNNLVRTASEIGCYQYATPKGLSTTVIAKKLTEEGRLTVRVWDSTWKYVDLKNTTEPYGIITVTVTVES